MKLTLFNDLHKQYGAKMVTFAGYEMPIQYPKGIIYEHKIVRNGVGVFDVSHMGEFEVKGKDDQQNRTKREYLKEWIEAVNFDSRFGKWSWDVSFRTSDIKDKIKKHSKNDS